MSRLPTPHLQTTPDYRLYLFPLALIGIVPLFPPETRGESMAGVAVLATLFVVLTRERRPPFERLLPLIAAASLYFPAALLALAPGTVVPPIAVATLALALGIYTAALDPERRSRDTPCLVLGGIAALVAAHALYQSMWGLDALARSVEAGGDIAGRELVLARARGGRAFAAFATPAALGGFFALALPATVGASLGRRGRARWWLVGSATLQLLALVASASATAGVSLAVALSLSLFASASRKAWPRIAVTLAIMVAVLAAIVWIRGEEVTAPGSANSPWRLRAGNFRIAGEMIGDHPWAGVGAGGFGEAYPAYRRTGDNETQHAHNLPLELSAEWGIPLGAFLSVLFFRLYLGPLFWSRRKSWERGVAVGLAALALQNLVDFTILLPSLLWCSAVLRGWIAPTPPPGQRCASRLPAAAAACSVGLAAVLAFLTGLAWNERVAARDAVAAGELERAQQHTTRATFLAPWNPDGWLYRAQIAADLETPEARPAPGAAASLRDVERAIELSPTRPAARMVRARLRAAQGDLPGALADAAEAARLYPSRAEYARVRDDVARRLAESATDRTGSR